jgi:hypothetical protein
VTTPWSDLDKFSAAVPGDILSHVLKTGRVGVMGNLEKGPPHYGLRLKSAPALLSHIEELMPLVVGQIEFPPENHLVALISKYSDGDLQAIARHHALSGVKVSLQADTCVFSHVRVHEPGLLNELAAVGWLMPAPASGGTDELPTNAGIDWPDLSEEFGASGPHIDKLPPAPKTEPNFTSPRPTIPDEKVRSWYEARVNECTRKGEQPSEAVDWRAAQDEFGEKIRREQLRGIRKTTAPAEWRRQGRRRKGRKNSAEKFCQKISSADLQN